MFPHSTVWRLLALPLVLASACDPPDPDAALAAEVLAAGDDAHCDHTPQSTPFERTQVELSLPPMSLIDQNGEAYALSRLETSDRPVALNFIFATCTTICPVMTATFSQLRDELGDDADRVHMVSITIDPSHDTPAVLADYARKHNAPADWLFLSGPTEDVEVALKAFDAWTPTKFNHSPITLLRAPGQSDWTRLDGLGSGTALAEQVRPMLAKTL